MPAPDDLAGQVVIVTGPPGAGKTTAADAIASASPIPAVHLRADDFWHCIKSGYIKPFLPESHAQNVVVIDALVAAAATYAGGGYLVIVDGIVGPWFLEPFRRLTAPLHYIVLRPSLATASDRVHGRGDASLVAVGAVEQLHHQFSELGDLEAHVIDTTVEAPAETQAAIIAAVGSGRFRLH